MDRRRIAEAYGTDSFEHVLAGELLKELPNELFEAGPWPDSNSISISVVEAKRRGDIIDTTVDVDWTTAPVASCEDIPAEDHYTRRMDVSVDPTANKTEYRVYGLGGEGCDD